ncbi:protein preY, mitochondrial [Octodon degus]|uniref:Protein preY, mitochondrial n=1 Tax=Octodon degus TaxID=10160 RepID=A0A6P6DRJ1_OCTDE|nr:protein preY, mitochondrial [Octodon degus]
MIVSCRNPAGDLARITVPPTSPTGGLEPLTGSQPRQRVWRLLQDSPAHPDLRSSLLHPQSSYRAAALAGRAAAAGATSEPTRRRRPPRDRVSGARGRSRLGRRVVSGTRAPRWAVVPRALRAAGSRFVAGASEGAEQPPRAFDPALLEFLVCPLSKKPLRYEASTNELINEELGIAYPIIDGIPNMIPQTARAAHQQKKQEETEQH